MSRSDSEHVRAFVDRHVDSAGLLETLLRVHGGEREWTPEPVARSVYTVPAGATRRLEQLAEMGPVSPTATADP